MHAYSLSRKLISLVLFISLLLGLVTPAAGSGLQQPAERQDPLDKIEPALLTQLASSEEVEFFIWMKEKADLRNARAFKDKEKKGQFVYDTLVETARRTQAGVLRDLAREGRVFHSFYIANKIFVRGGSQALVMALANRPDVERITANHTYQLEEPYKEDGGSITTVGGSLSFINADDVWAAGVTGEGIVLAGNDTGLDWEHPAIRNHYRGWNGTAADHNYNWWDATETYPLVPGDGHGHGTHTTGTMVGDDGAGNQIGVAPGAKTIHCKNMTDGGSGNDYTFTTCFEWDLAPWNLTGNRSTARPDLAPDVINNSWGYWGGEVSVFRDEIAALQAAGILVEVSAGNEGDDLGCNSLRSPGDYAEVLTTGSVDWYSGSLPGFISYFSSRGPSSLDGGTFPDVMAPGSNIRSSVPGGDYESWSGTSMAGPHVVGLVGLLWSANPGLRGMIAETTTIIKDTAVPLTGQTGFSCGGDYAVGPNQDWGDGTVDAYAAYQLAMSYGGPGTLQGTVTDADGAPLEGASITVTDGSRTFRATTDAAGFYSMTVWEGTYEVSAAKWGYAPQTQSGVVITAGEITEQSFTLSAAQTYIVRGTIYDLTAGRPLYGRIRVSVGNLTPPPPYDRGFSYPLSGWYRLQLPEGMDYTFTVEALVPGYLPAVVQTGMLTADRRLNIGLEADLDSCTAPGWGIDPLLQENFDGGALPDGWTIIDHAGTGAVWRFDDPFARGNQTGGEGSFATADLGYNDIATMDTSLVTPVFDLTGTSRPSLSFDTYFYNSDWSEASIEVSLDGTTWSEIWNPYPYPSSPPYTYEAPPAGSEVRPRENPIWQTVWMQTTSLGPDYHAVLDLSALAGQPSVQLRFNFFGHYIGVWQVDNVLIGDCRPRDGSFVVGHVSGPRGERVVGASVYSELAPEAGVLTFATPDDPQLRDGWYVLFVAPDSPQDITVSGPQGYGSVTTSVVIPPDESAFQTFTLPAADFSADVAEVQATVELGATASATFMLQNIGTITGEYRFFEIRPTPISTAAGAVVRRVAVEGPPFLQRGAKPEEPPPAPQLSLNPTELPWAYAAPLPEPIAANVAVALDGKVYSLTGVNDRYYSQYASSYVYDPDLDSWSAIADPPTLRDSAGAGAIDDKIYLVGGYDSDWNLPDVLEIYDPATNTWSIGAPIPMPGTGAAPGVAVYDGQLYLMGGWLYGYHNHVFRYDPPTDTWTQLADMPVGLAYSSCGVLTGQIVCAGGYNWNGQASGKLYAYHPDTNTWSTLADLPEPVYGAAAVASQGKLYLNGGIASGSLTNETWVYDALTNQWSYGPASNYATYHAGSACGFNRVGGFAYAPYYGWYPTPYHEVYPGLDDCSGDVAWMYPSPQAGTVDAGGAAEITVHFDASVAEIEQPGEYAAELWVANSSPYGPFKVSVTMNVTPPAAWGHLNGVVNGLSHCDQPGAPLADAQVTIWKGETLVRSLNTGPDGHFGWWIEQGAYTLEIAAGGFVSRRFDVVVAGQPTNSRLDLRVDESCPAADPQSISVTAVAGESAVEELQILNQGAGAMEYAILETLETDPPAAGYAAGEFSPPAAVGPLSVRWKAEGAPAGEQAEHPEVTSLAWFEGAPLPPGYSIPMRYARAQCPGDSSRFYMISGVNWSGVILNQNLRYDADANSWSALAPIPIGAEGASAVCYGGFIYVMGGSGTDRFYIYNINADTWSTGPALPRQVWGAAAGAWKGRLYLIGGDNDFYEGGSSPAVDIFDIATGTWSSGTSMPVSSGTVAPGSAQVGSYLYIVGGYGSTFDANQNLTLRYDMDTDTWESGPVFTSARADFGLAATRQALYALGGDADGGEGREPTNAVERLAIGEWPGGNWTEYPSALPKEVMSNSGGFCTSAVGDSEIWSTYGYPYPGPGSYDARNYFRTIDNETCASILSEIEWLEETPPAGSVAPDSAVTATITLNAADLAPGNYTARLIVMTDDSVTPEKRVPVALEVLPRVLTVALTPDTAAQSALAGTNSVYTLTVTNQGNVTGRYDITAVGNTWTVVTPQMTPPLDPGESAAFEVVVSVPAGAAGGASDAVSIQVTSQEDPAVTAVSVLTTTSTPVYALAVTPAIQTGEARPGETAAYELEVANLGNTADTFTISVTGSAWAATAPSTLGPVEPGESAVLTVSVAVPADAVGNTTDTANIAIVSSHAPSAAASAILTTTASPVFEINLEAVNGEQSAGPGQSAIYNLNIQNVGNLPVTVLIELAGHTWLSAPSATLVGPINSGETGALTVTVMVPAEAEADASDVLTVTARVVGAAAASDTVTLTTTVANVAGLTLTPSAITAEGTSMVDVSYTLALTNTGNRMDRFTAVVSGNAWPTVVTGLGDPLASGVTRNVLVRVSIPAEALDGSSDAAAITVTSQNDPNQKRSANLTTISRNVYAVTASLDRAEGVGYVGRQVNFTITLTNQGNVRDDYNLSFTGNHWPIRLASGDLTGVMPGESRTVILSVDIPPDSLQNQIDTVEVILTSVHNGRVAFATRLKAQSTWHQMYLPVNFR